MTDRRIERRIAKIKEIESTIAELEKEADAIRDELKKDLEERGLEEIAVRNYVVRWRTIQTNRLDGKALQKALPEIYKQFLKPCTSRRFTIV